MSSRLLAVLATILLAIAPAAADSHLAVRDAWSRATAPSQKNGAVFLTIDNAGGPADRLTGAGSPHAERVELHNHTMQDGVMRMRPVPSVDVPAGGSVTLEPGGYHVMLMGLTAALEEGDVVPLTLTFEHAGTIEVDAMILGAGASGAGAYAPRGNMDGHGGGGMQGHGTHGGMKK